MVPGIAEEVKVAPNTRKEISKIGWIQLCLLPGWDAHAVEEKHSTANLKFWSVAEFVPGIKRWVESRLADHGL